MLLVRRARDLQRHLAPAINGRGTSVHQARVASRRLREAVPVLAGDSKPRRKAERKIRRVTQALGTVRELDVTVQILDEFARRPGIPRDALEDVRTHVVAERDRRREEMVERLKGVNTEKLYRRLEEVAIELPLAPTHQWREALGSRVGHRARRLADCIHIAGQMYAPEHLHAVRIATKKLRYALELVADSRVTMVRPLLNTLKRAQDTLGRLHDLQIIERHVAAVQALPPARREADSKGLGQLARMLGEECRHLHARYIKQVPALLELINTCQASTVTHIARRGARRQVKMLPARDIRAAVAKRA